MADLVMAVKNSNQIMGQLIAAIKAAFPQNASTATTATAGSATLPATPAGFLVVNNPVTGLAVKIPYYNN